MKNLLIIKKKYLIFRNDAQIIRDFFFKKKKVFLDFSYVNFLSRSFVDELLNIIDEFKSKKKDIKIINLKPENKKQGITF